MYKIHFFYKKDNKGLYQLYSKKSHLFVHINDYIYGNNVSYFALIHSNITRYFNSVSFHWNSPNLTNLGRAGKRNEKLNLSLSMDLSECLFYFLFENSSFSIVITMNSSYNYLILLFVEHFYEYQFWNFFYHWEIYHIIKLLKVCILWNIFTNRYGSKTISSILAYPSILNSHKRSIEVRDTSVYL